MDVREMGLEAAWDTAVKSPGEGSRKRGLCGRTMELLSTYLPGINPHNAIDHMQNRQLGSLLCDHRKSRTTEGESPQAEPQY